MKKKIGIISILALFIGLNSVFNLVTIVRGASFGLFYFDTDRDAYHVSGNIKINATWDLNSNPAIEISYTQVQIYDSSNVLVWNSSIYNETGSYDEIWVVNILNLSLADKDVNILFVRFVYYSYHYITMFQMDIVLSEKQVTIHKERIDCQLNNFKESLTSLETLDIGAQFYDLINGAYIINQEIFFEMLASGSKLYDSNFTTNSMGKIEFSIDVLSQMSLGNNTLRFSITNSQLYNTTVFEYSVFVGQPEAGGPGDNNIVLLITSSLCVIGMVGLIVFIRIRK